jgi:putative endonuclease
MANRLDCHNKGKVKYTSSRLPVVLILTISFIDKYKAYDFENYLKSGSGRAFMIKRFI